VNTEENAKSLIDEHLRTLNWNLADFTQITKEYPIPGGERADYAILVNGSPAAIIEAKKHGMDLNAALVQAKNYECISIGKRQNLFEMATNPALTFTQFSNSQLLQQKGGI
jgi:hypothetical protein